jgi:RNA polymerase sigma-70 factor (ECF subfamily)
MDRLCSLVRYERRALVSVARSEGLNAEESLECVQDALLTMLGRDDPPEHAIATLKTVVRNAARNFRRRHRRAKDHQPFDEERGASSEPDAEGLVSHAEDVVRLRMCVAELCGVQRAVVMLRLLEERSGEDVAVTLGLTRGHVDVLVHRAKAALRVCMRHSA